MRCRCIARVLLDPVKRSDALAHFLGQLRSVFRPIDGSSLRFYVSVGQNRGLLLALADGLPKGAPGFRAELFASTAEPTSTIAPNDTDSRAYDGDLLSHLDWNKSLSLIERCLTTDPAWLRGAHAGFAAENLVMAGAPSDSVWRVVGSGLTRHASKRVEISLQTALDVDSTDEKAVKRTLRDLGRRSGLPLARARIGFEPAKPDAVADTNRLTDLALFNGELFGALADKLRPIGMRWRDVPDLQPSADAFYRRMDAILAGSGPGRVELMPAVRRFAKQHFPDCEIRNAPDAIELIRRLTDEADLSVAITKVHRQVGKCYGVRLGVRLTKGPLAGRLFAAPLFHCFDHGPDDPGLVWAYETVEDQARCLAQTQRLLGLVLPEFEQRWRDFLVDGKSVLTADLPEHGLLTFHDAVRIAARSLGPFRPSFPELSHATLRDLGGRHPAGDTGSSATDVTGRAAAGQEWWIRFIDPVRGQTVTAIVPWRGHVRLQRGYGVSVDRDGVTHTIDGSPEPDDLFMLEKRPDGDADRFSDEIESALSSLADSPDVMACADGAGGAAFRNDHRQVRVGASFRIELREGAEPDAYWWIEYRSITDTTHDLLHFRVSARPPLVAQRLE